MVRLFENRGGLEVKVIVIFPPWARLLRLGKATMYLKYFKNYYIIIISNIVFEVLLVDGLCCCYCSIAPIGATY